MCQHQTKTFVADFTFFEMKIKFSSFFAEAVCIRKYLVYDLKLREIGKTLGQILAK